MTRLMSWSCVHPVRMEKDMERVGVNTARHLAVLTSRVTLWGLEI